MNKKIASPLHHSLPASINLYPATLTADYMGLLALRNYALVHFVVVT